MCVLDCGGEDRTDRAVVRGRAIAVFLIGNQCTQRFQTERDDSRSTPDRVRI